MFVQGVARCQRAFADWHYQTVLFKFLVFDKFELIVVVPFYFRSKISIQGVAASSRALDQSDDDRALLDRVPVAQRAVVVDVLARIALGGMIERHDAAPIDVDDVDEWLRDAGIVDDEVQTLCVSMCALCVTALSY